MRNGTCWTTLSSIWMRAKAPWSSWSRGSAALTITFSVFTPTFTAGGSKARGTATEGPQAIAGWDWGSDGGGSNGGAGIVAAPAFGAGAGGGGGEACVSLKARKGGPSKTRPRRRWRGHAAPNVFDTRLRRRFPHAVDCSEPTEVQRGPNNHHRGAHPRHLGCTYCIPNASTSSIDTSPRSSSSGDFARRKDLAARESPLVSRKSGVTVVALYQQRGYCTLQQGRSQTKNQQWHHA